MGVLAGCYNTYNKPLLALDNNGLPSFDLNGSLFPPIRACRFWLLLKCLLIPKWFYISTGYATGAVMD
jgi:hypothetical protein